MSNPRAQQPDAGACNRSPDDPGMVACPNCDLMQRLPDLAPGQTARCPRCDSELRRRRTDSLDRTLALAIASAVLWIIANTMPMLGLTAVGTKCFTTVFRGSELLWEHGEPIVAALIFFAAILAPALQITLLLLVLLGARCEVPPFWVGPLLRHIPFTRLWSMVEVMLLGVMIALTKIAEYATPVLGHALFALGGLVVLFAAMQSIFDPHEIWERVQWAGAKAQNPSAGGRMKEAAA
ncbi:MAG TPA: paraquat-inducible protein A [Verrucomicrobiae bacterium]|nr:paraquat-inducible protein A [Verrucomicrobiae bacterium]